MKVLDTYCCSGGATRGYQLAGFHVTGVDIDPQLRYCGDEFHQGDAVQFIRDHGHEFDFIHASPPCQHDCTLTAGTNQGKFEYPDLLEPTREALKATGRPFVIEQPQGKASKRMRTDLKLCGEQFGLAVLRHRLFEVEGLEIPWLEHEKHKGRVQGYRHGEWFDGPYFAVYGDGGGKGSVQEWQDAMGIHWTDVRKELAEAIPPAYTEYIGKYVMDYLSTEEMAA